VPDFTDNADVSAAKSAIRGRLLARRRAMDAATRDEAAAAVVREVLSEVRRTGARRVCAYVPVGPEPGGSSLVPALAAAVEEVLLPVLRDDLDLDWAVYTGSLAPSARGLMSPVGPLLGVSAVGSAELVIVPAVAVDRSGLRLGRGGGSYDRALARVGSAPAVALLHDGELVSSDLPTAGHDRRVDGAITPALGLVWLRRLDETGSMTHH
jgi:5-formyltetrahydrofolate cyclo-ligase